MKPYVGPLRIGRWKFYLVRSHPDVRHVGLQRHFYDGPYTTIGFWWLHVVIECW